MSTTAAASRLHEARTLHVFLTRGVVALAWAAVFAAVANSSTSDVAVGAGILVVLYPVIDAVASLLDARSQDGSEAVRPEMLIASVVSEASRSSSTAMSST